MDSYANAIRNCWAERKRVGGARAKRLEFLFRWSAVKVAHKKNYERRRRAPSSRSWKRHTKANCWACHGVKATSRHHIIQVQHGGGNDDRNIVPLCDGCHAEVHPWMDATGHPVVAVTREWDEHRF